MNRCEIESNLRKLSRWVGAGDYFMVNGVRGFDAALFDTRKSIHLTFTEDDGGGNEAEECIEAHEIDVIEWDRSASECKILMNDGQGWTFTSFRSSPRNVPE